jgi:hypothetical protein
MMTGPLLSRARAHHPGHFAREASCRVFRVNAEDTWSCLFSLLRFFIGLVEDQAFSVTKALCMSTRVLGTPLG